MTRLARIHAESDGVPVGLDELARDGSLDLLQLDYVRPRRAVAIGAAAPELPEFAGAIADAVRSVCKTLFLEPDFRVVTSAGWSSSYACVEHVARALVEGGSPDVPVSAVRGSNLLGILDFLVADGLILDNVDTGAPWRSLREPVLAADLQVGAGPLAAALGEGARVIVAGCYDGAAPAIAAGVRQYDWSWKELDRLAAAAAASRAAIWPHQHACNWLAGGGALPAAIQHPRVEVDHRGSVAVDVAHPTEDADAQRLLQWLQSGKSRDPSHLHADVQVNSSRAVVSREGSARLRVDGCTGADTDGKWRLEVLYQAGFVVEAMIEFTPGVERSLRRQIAEAFRTHFVNADDERSLVAVQELGPADDAMGGSSWLHFVCRSKGRQPCAEFVAHITRLASSNHGLVRLPTGRPTIHVECGVWPARIPRSAVDIAIDTRPAKEWG